MGLNKEDVDGEQPLCKEGIIRPIDGTDDQTVDCREPVESGEELDEFGLPAPKFVVGSGRSSRSGSFESARSSIDVSDAARSCHDEDDSADVEDNDIEEDPDVHLTSTTEWPRTSGSPLPGVGYVKSSPFHRVPEPCEQTGETVYAERAKELLKLSPVSNSVFRRQDLPRTEQSLPQSPSSTAVPELNESVLKETPSVAAQIPQEEIVKSKPPETAPDLGNPEPEQPVDTPKLTVSTDVTHSPTNSRVANVFFDSPDESALNPAGASEWSHQLGVAQSQTHNAHDPRKSLDDDGWQDMPAYGTYDIYDDDGKMLTKQFSLSDDEGDKDDAGKGYTRMNQDEDAQSADSMDENTQYLFTESIDDENAKTPLSQMETTKELLTEGQRIAYVGLCKLTMAGMLRDVGRVRYKENRAAYESMTLWSQKMMIRLFGHMDISPDEQVMIEQLAEHGVIPEDLIPSLMVNVEVANPFHTPRTSSDNASLSSQQSIISESSKTSLSPPGTPSTPRSVQSPSTVSSQKLALDLRWTVLCDLFLVLIADSVYDSRSRVLLERMGAHLGVEWIDITRFERRVAEALQIQENGEQTWKEDSIVEARAKQARNRRYMMMGLATLGGGLVIGLSAGLLAPVIGAGLGAAFTTVGITGTTGFLAGTGGAALITSGGIATGGAIAGRGMAKRTRSVKTFEFRPLHNNQRVNLLITVSGWMSSKEDDIRLPFSTLDPVVGDVISLLWEPEVLQSMGQTFNLLATEILTQSLQQLLGQTVLIALMSSIQWPMMLTKLSYLIDNPWSISLDRAAAAGLILADTLIHRYLGQRPISLAGFSLGARVIYFCLLELAKVRAFGIIQDVYLFGAPILIKQKECLRAQSIVAGRFVNGYKSNDWILGYLFRATSTGIGRVAGLGPIENCGDIENLDCTEIVQGHLYYRDNMPRLMKETGFLVISEEFDEMEDPDPDKHREKQIALYDEIEEAKRLVAQEDEEARKLGKKVKKPGKSGFLGLWGKEIQEKPILHAKKPSDTMDYDLNEDNRVGGNEDLEKKTDSKGPADGDDNILFDVDKMNEELTANGITPRSLESTLPALVVSAPVAVPVSGPLMELSSAPSAKPVPPQMSPSSPPPSRPSMPESRSPSLPSKVSRNDTPSVSKPAEDDIQPRDITPKRELKMLVVNTMEKIGKPTRNEWDDGPEGGGEITMSFELNSPDGGRFPTSGDRHSTSPHGMEERPGVRQSSVFSMPFERNVWDDDDYGSRGNITMSFE